MSIISSRKLTSFTLCWYVIGAFNSPQTNHKHNGKGMWLGCVQPFLWGERRSVTSQITAAKEIKLMVVQDRSAVLSFIMHAARGGGIMEWGQKSKPKKFPRASSKLTLPPPPPKKKSLDQKVTPQKIAFRTFGALKISRKYKISGFKKQMQCN